MNITLPLGGSVIAAAGSIRRGGCSSPNKASGPTKPTDQQSQRTNKLPSRYGKIQAQRCEQLTLPGELSRCDMSPTLPLGGCSI